MLLLCVYPQISLESYSMQTPKMSLRWDHKLVPLPPPPPTTPSVCTCKRSHMLVKDPAVYVRLLQSMSKCCRPCQTGQLWKHSNDPACTDRAGHFPDRCDINDVVKVVHRNQLVNDYNWSDILPSTNTTTGAFIANTLFRSLSTTHTCTCINETRSLSLLHFWGCCENRSSKITAGMSDQLLVLFPVYAHLNQ